MNKLINWRGIAIEELSPEELARRQEIGRKTMEKLYLLAVKELKEVRKGKRSKGVSKL